MIRPRKWQSKAVDQCVSMANNGMDRALVFACPGSGKTVGGLLIAIGLRDRANKSRKLVVLTPNLAIKSQWIERSASLGLNLIAVEDPHALQAQMDDMFAGGFVLTYQQAMSMRQSLRLFCDTHQPIVILDEVHHTSGPLGSRDGNAWGTSIEYSLAKACFKLATTGTPFREGPNPIAFVDYNEEGRAHAHVEYGYKQAIEDRICRPIEFEIYDGGMEWTDARGVATVADFRTKLTKVKSRERLRAAVSADGRFPVDMLTDAHARLMELRGEPGGEKAGGLVVAMDIEHAEAMARHLAAISGIKPVIVHNRIDDSLGQIQAFRDGDAPWIIGIQMLSEGVDIPRLRVGAYCTNIRATLYFHQFCGRVVRVQTSDLERAYVFLPADPELEATALQIQEEVAHALGEEPSVRERRMTRGARGQGGIEVEDSAGKLDKTVVSGRAIPSDYLQRHEATIRKYAALSPSFKNLTRGEIVIFLVEANVLPPFDGEAA